jgi:adenosylhomocysteine nucleosidase
MLGVIVASDSEASPFLDALKWRKISSQPFSVYQGELGPLKIPTIFIISGMGKVAAAVATHLLIHCHRVTWILNLGACGALKESHGFKPGALFRIDTAIEGDRQDGPFLIYPEKCASDLFDNLPSVRLVTCDRPVFDLQRKESLSTLGDLIDMEGAAVARVANMYTRPCVLVKGITDEAKEGERQTLTQNIGMVSKKMANLFINVMTSLTNVDNDVIRLLK